MVRRFHVFLVICWAAGMYYIHNSGALDGGPIGTADHFFNMQRQKAQAIKDEKEARDTELLQLAELRKKNAEIYGGQTYPPARPAD